VLTDEKLHLEQQLRTEQEARRALEGVISKIAELVR